MAKSSIDRNIMFGIVAVQTGTIAIDQMQASFRDWMKDKSKPVSEILKTRGVLSDDQCRALDTQVDVALEKSTDFEVVDSSDVNKSITASLQDFADDSDFQIFVDNLGINTADNTHSISGNTVGSATLTGRFRIVRPHAKGGLGEVFVAIDEELDREVALKQIQSRGADNKELRDRFLREAEITGKLEHPGIVPVYGMGHDEGGRPYYAMRFIRGKSMRNAIDEFHSRDPNQKPDVQIKELRRLLGWFNDVCQALAYAHSRGVIHRDLKPDNIMLGRYGETLVVDWGLARTLDKSESAPSLDDEVPVQTHLDSGSAATMAGTAMGTPAYMSPEQAQGRLEELSPRSDIYSLGATLYSILVGKSPIAGSDIAEILRNVSAGKFDRPRMVDSSIPKPLEAVCLKAMSLKPEDRYETPLELANDIEAWLADSPVSAWEEPLSVRTNRWVKNNKTLVVGAAATIVVALISSLIASAFLSSKNQELVKANTVATKKTKIANEQSELSLETMSQVIKDFQSVFEARQAPELMTKEMNDARKNMLNNAVAGMKKISTHLQAREGYSDALVVAHTDLGQLYLSVGNENYEDGRENAQIEFEAAMEVCRRWLAAEPENKQAQRRFAEVASRLGRLAWFSDDLDSAIVWIQQAIETAEKMAKSTDEKHRQVAFEKLWNFYFEIGTIEFRRFQLDKSVDWYRKSLSLYEESKSKGIEILDKYDREETLPEIHRRIEIFSSLPKIRKNVEHAFTLSEGVVGRALYDCAAWQAFDGDHAGAYKTLRRMDSMELTTKEYYSNACGYARCAKALLNGREIDELSEAESELVEKYSSLSVAMLRRSMETGFFEAELALGLLGRDTDLDVIRHRDDFKKFVDEARSKPASTKSSDSND